MRVAIFDLGSTTFHLLVVDVVGGELRRLLRRRETLHLAAAAAADGHIPHDAAFRALRAVRSLRKDADKQSPEIVLATATSALRDADNGHHLLERMGIVLRSPIRVLDGATEAALAFDGATAGLGIADERVLVADLGGGSLDIAVGRPDRIDHVATYPLGASRMTAVHVRHDPLTHEETWAIAQDVSTACGPLFEQLSEEAPARVIVAGGSGRTVARAWSGREDVDGLVVPTAALHATTARLTSMPRAGRESLPHIPPRRAGVLPAGAVILSTLLDGLDAGSMTVSTNGLREGLLLELLAELRAAPVRLAR